MRRQISPWIAGAQDVEEGFEVQRHDLRPVPSSSGPPSLDYRMNEEALSRRAVCRLRVSLLNMAPSQLPPIPGPSQKYVLFAKTPPSLQKIELRQLPATKNCVDEFLFFRPTPNFFSLPIGYLIPISTLVDLVQRPLL